MGFWGFYIDPLYLIVFFLTLFISMAAQVFISSQYRKWGSVRNGPNLTGREVGYAIVNRTSLGGGYPMAVVAHELGHAQQILTAAASTYIAAAITAILQLLYYISIARRRS